MKHLIVKVQTSLHTTAEEQQCLIYDKTRALMQEFPVSPEIKKAMGGHNKRYFHATFADDGTLALGDTAKGVNF